MEPSPTPPPEPREQPAFAPFALDAGPPPAPPAPPDTAPGVVNPAAAATAGAPQRPLTWMRMAWFFYGVVVLFALGYALFSGTLRTVLGEATPRAHHLLAAVGLACLVVAACHVGTRLWRPMARAGEAVADILGPLKLRDVLLLAALSGLAEELLFRGALWPALGLWGTTLLFGLVHLVPHRALWIYPLFAAAAGLLLGLLRDGTESVFPSMLAHAVINGLNLAWLSRLAQARAAARLPVATRA